MNSKHRGPDSAVKSRGDRLLRDDKSKRWEILFFICFALQMAAWFYALFCVGADRDQGDVYRIMFVHVPVAWCAFFWIFTGAICSICALLVHKKAVGFDLSACAAMQLGALFSFLVLVTGSIWGRPTWGVWWDWDPRLTSSLVMFLIACSYLILRHTTHDPVRRRNMCGLVAILCAVNVPIVYYSVNLWRSLHQSQSFVQKSVNVSSDIAFALVANTLCMFALSIVLHRLKKRALSAEESLLQARAEEGDQL